MPNLIRDLPKYFLALIIVLAPISAFADCGPGGCSVRASRPTAKVTRVRPIQFVRNFLGR